ncbi:Enterobacterial TraT complement resistance protein [Enterobacter hormaechei]|nr:Enterobacterial TraT complement resistance protein [Enterobacter hormaechei]
MTLRCLLNPWRFKYQTRVVSNANKVNLKFEEAKPVLEAQLAKSIAGIM